MHSHIDTALLQALVLFISQAVHSPQIDGDYYAMNSVHEQLWCQNTQGTAVPFRPSDEDMASAYGEQEGEEAAQDEQVCPILTSGMTASMTEYFIATKVLLVCM